MPRLFRLLIALVFLAAGPALAQRGSSPVDPNVLGVNTGFPGGAINTNVAAVSLRAAQTPNPAVRNLGAVVLGQSNCTAITPGTYSISNTSALDQLFIDNGGVYNALDPPLGVSLNSGGGFPLMPMFDDLVTVSLFDRILIVPICIGGTSAANWATGNQSDRVGVALSRLRAKGWVTGTNITVIVLVLQGETDNTNGTTQASYAASWNASIASSRALGFSGPWFFAKETRSSGAVSSAVQTAQTCTGTDCIINNGSSVYTAGDLDAISGSTCGGLACRQGDDTHFSNAARATISTTIRAALHTALPSVF